MTHENSALPGALPDAAAEPRSVASPRAGPLPPPTAGEELDRRLHALQAWFAGGQSPSTMRLAFLDWAAHAANSPFRSAELMDEAVAQWRRLAGAATGGPTAIAPQPGDHRFDNPSWRHPPFSLATQAVLLAEDWWSRMVQGPGGVDPRNRRLVAFAVRQLLDRASPSNVAWLNPQVIVATRANGGVNLMTGMRRAGRTMAGRAEGTSMREAFRADAAATRLALSALGVLVARSLAAGCPAGGSGPA